MVAPSLSTRPAPRVIDVSGGSGVRYARYVAFQERLRDARREVIVFCQHPPTLTAGVQGKSESLAVPEERLAELGVAHAHIGRGGDYTAHEPGQLVIYPHLDLEERGLGIGELVRLMLSVTRSTLAEVWGIDANTVEGLPGLYVEERGSLAPAKICSIGLMFKSFFSSFGLSLNVSNSLETFRLIHPCGETDRPLASVQSLGGDVAAVGRFTARWREEFLVRLG